MTNFQKLKHEARKAEQRSDWARAIDLYRRALESDADMADLSLYNRIGDLHLRQGEAAEAVEYYEQAVDRYADNDMYTSAIALCNKILRIAPDRTGVYRRLGGLHAKAGLLAEGRGNCMTYVTSALEQGSPHEALEAVEEFVGETADEEIRLQFAEALIEHEQPALAADQLAVVYRIRRSRGSDAEDLLARIESIGGEEAVEHAQEEAEEAVREAAAAEQPPRTPDRLADLVVEALGDEADRVGFEPVAPEPPAPERSRDDGLGEIRSGYAEFRESVADQIDGDPSVRYDLGVELMTIGLMEEALTEFRAAVADPGLVEAATARIGECLVLQGSVAAVSPPSPVAPPIPSFVRSDRAPDDPPFTFAPPAGTTNESTSEPDPESASEPAVVAGDDEDDELQGHFFKARLAQYRIRRADERHTIDHAAHLELAAAYVEMELLQEAVREYSVALHGPRKVARDAARGLVGLAVSEEAAPELSLHVLETLSGADHPKASARLGEMLAEAWGADHPFAERLAAARSETAGGELPHLEEMFPALDAAPAEADPAPQPIDAAPQEADPAPAESAFEAEDLAELDELLAQLDDVSDDGARTAETGAGVDLAEARRLVEAGDPGGAADLLTGALERLEAERRTREALEVIQALLDIRRDDVMLHHHHTELALMANDRATLVAAFSGLGACLRREGALTSARAAYGRMLDFDPENADARAAIEAIDAEEISVESVARRHDDLAQPDPERSEFDELLRDLDTNGDGPAGEVVSPGTADDGTETNSHFELGMAFKQMGMWDEAIHELEASLASSADRLGTLAALAESFVQGDRSAEAVSLLADELRDDEDAEQVAVLYWFGRALQNEGEVRAAHDVLARVEAVSPGYRDVTGRLSELSL